MLSPSVIFDSVTPWAVAHQAPLSMGFSRQEYWSGLLCPPPGDLPNPGIKLRSPALQAGSLLSEAPVKPSGKVAVFLIRPSHDWMMPTHIMGDSLLYSESTDLNINFIKNIPSQQYLR